MSATKSKKSEVVVPDREPPIYIPCEWARMERRIQEKLMEVRHGNPSELGPKSALEWVLREIFHAVPWEPMG